MTSLVRPSLASVNLPFTKFCSTRSAIPSLHPPECLNPTECPRSAASPKSPKDELRRDGLSPQVIQLLSLHIPTKSVDEVADMNSCRLGHARRGPDGA